MTYERNHYLGPDIHSLFPDQYRCFHDSFYLHVGHFRVSETKSATSVTEHGIKFLQTFHCLTNFLKRNSHPLSNLSLSFLVMGNKFVQGRIKQSYCTGFPIKRFEYTIKIFSLEWQKFFHSTVVNRQWLIEFSFKLFPVSCTLFDRLSQSSDPVSHQNHFSECSYPVTLEKHMLCTAKANSFCSEQYCHLGIFRCVGICSHFKRPDLISPGDESGIIS